MAVVKNLMVRAGADFSAITKQAAKAKGSMRSMSSSVASSCSKMSAAVSSLNKMLGALGVALSVGALVNAGKQAKEAYDVQAEAEAKLAQVMRNTMGASAQEIKSIKELTAAQQALGVVGDEVQLEGAQELATYLSLSSSLKTLIPVLNDMTAQQYGLSATTENAVNIATMMGKVMNGQTSALSRYGYSFDAAQEKILKYGTEEQRAATLAEVVEQSVGGMNAALAATPSGRLKQVSNTLSDIKEEFGRAVTSIASTFLPVLNTVCNVLAAMATLANKVAQAIANVFGKSGSSSAAAQTVSYTAAAASGMDDLAESTTAAGKAAKALNSMGFDTLQILSQNSTSGSSGSTAGGSAGGGGTISTGFADEADQAGESIGWLEAGLQRIRDTIDGLNFGKLSESFGRLKEAAQPLVDIISQGLGWAYDNVLAPLATWTIEEAAPAGLDVLSSALNVLTEVIKLFEPLGTWLWDNFLKPISKWVGNKIVEGLENMSKSLDKVAKFIRENQDLVRTLGVAIGAVAVVIWALTAPISTVTTVIAILVAGIAVLAANWDTVKKAGADAWDKIKSAWNGAGEWFGNIGASIKTKWNDATTAIKNLGKDAWSGVKSAWSSAGSWFKNSVTTPISTGFKTFANGIIGFFEGIANGAINGVNRIIAGLNRINFDVPDWVPLIGGKSFGFNLKSVSNIKLPRLATGAVIPPNNSFAAILGDQRSGTNIETPERLLRQIYREETNNSDILYLLRALLDAVRAGHVIELDRRQVGKTARQEQERQDRAYAY